MTGTGYGRAMSLTISERPTAISGSISWLMMSTIVVSRRATARGVNALDTSRRRRAWSAPLTLSSDACDTVPQRPGRDALSLEAQPWRRAQPVIAQRGVGQFVAQNLRPVRAHGDGALLPRLLEALVGDLRGWAHPRTKRWAGRLRRWSGSPVTQATLMSASSGRDAFMVWPHQGDR